jgi:ABC-type Na+ transport system ATPase subunit NatA
MGQQLRRFISILLVVLGWTAEKALEEYIDFTVRVLDLKNVDVEERTTALKNYVSKLLKMHEIKDGMRLLDLNARSRGCKLCVACAIFLIPNVADSL